MKRTERPTQKTSICAYFNSAQVSHLKLAEIELNLAVDNFAPNSVV